MDEAPRLAIEAGCDLLIYRSEAATRHAYAALSKALDEGRLDPDRVIQAAELSMSLKEEDLLPYEVVEPKEAAAFTGQPEFASWLKTNFG